MEVRSGYKQTEVGVIPEDWDAEALGAHVVIRSGLSPSLFHFETTGTPYFKVDQLNNEPKYLTTTPYFIRGEQMVLKGSLIFPKRGASILLNKVRILVHDAFMDTNLMTLTPKEALDSDYLYYALTHIQLWRVADTTSIPQINNKHIIPLVIPCPSKAEQRAIATALSDVDALLSKLDALIAKKRDLKQAAMQQLLTGQTRLPGFSGEWEVKRLGDVGRFLKGSGVKKDESLSGDLRCIRYGEIYTRHNDYIKEFNSWISPGVAQTAVPLKTGDLCFAGSGETKEEIGKCVAFVDEVVAYAGGDIVILRPDNSNSVFLGYYLNTPPINTQKASRGQGDAVVHISATALSTVQISVPGIAEQAAIATVLCDMDAELTALEARRDKTRALKQGMMQALLTGRIRLV